MSCVIKLCPWILQQIPALSCAVRSDLSVLSAESIGSRWPARAAVINIEIVCFVTLEPAAAADAVETADEAEAVAASGRGGAESADVDAAFF